VALKYPDASERKWTRSLSANAGEYSAAQVIPGFVDDLVAMVKPGGGGQVALEFTADDEETVDGNPGSVTWIQWNVGFVTINTAQTALGAVTAVRIRALAQPATCTLVGNRRKR
jgi:hypothetical protein